MTRGLRVSAIVLCVLSFTMARTASAGAGSSTDPGSPQHSTQADGAFTPGFGVYGPGYSVHHTTQTGNTKSFSAHPATAHVTDSPNSHGVAKVSPGVFDPKDSHNQFVRTGDGKSWDHQSDGHKFDDHDYKFDDRDHRFDDHHCYGRDFDRGHDKVDLRFAWIDKVDLHGDKMDDHNHWGDDRDRKIDDHDRKFDNHDNKFGDQDHDHDHDFCRAASR